MFVVPFDVHFHYIDNAFLCMHVAAAQSELNEARIFVIDTHKHPPERPLEQRVPLRELLKFIYMYSYGVTKVI